MRFVLLHHHIFKNAGSTLDSALEHHFGDAFVEFHSESSDDGRVVPQKLFQFLDENPHVRAVSSHHFLGRDYELDLASEARNKYYFFDFVLLRHPVSRLASIYLYYRGLPRGEHPLQVASLDLPFRDFVEFVMAGFPHFAVSPQTTMFGCRHYGALASELHLERAKARLAEVAMLGVVEDYAASMVVAEYFMQPVFPGLRLDGSIRNVSARGGIEGYDGTLASIETALGAELYSELCQLNDLDIKLWSWAKEEAARRARNVPGFSGRLEEFRRRRTGT